MPTRLTARRRNRVANALHVVWTTHHRRPMVTEEIERSVHRCIEAEAQRLGATVFAINGMPDHVHVIVLLPPTVALSHLLQRMKGVSSRLARTELAPERAFRWADGYAAFSVCRGHRDSAIAYVARQKEHHADLALRRGWEEVET